MSKDKDYWHNEGQKFGASDDSFRNVSHLDEEDRAAFEHGKDHAKGQCDRANDRGSDFFPSDAYRAGHRNADERKDNDE